MNKQIIAVFSLLLVISMAGCVGGLFGSDVETQEGGPPQKDIVITPGVEVSSFLASPSKVESGDAVDLSLDIKNLGGNLSILNNISLFQVGGFTVLDDVTKLKNLGTLEKAEPELNIPGETLTVFWSLTAPIVVQEQAKTLNARINYDYTSSAVTNIHLVPKEVYDELGSETFPVTVSSSTGPVSVDISEIPPFRFAPVSTQDTKTAHLVVVFRNTGSGTVVGNLRNFNVEVTGAEDVTFNEPDCDGVASDRSIKLFGAVQERSIKCDLELPYLDSAVSYIVDVSADYEYYTDTGPLMITVKEARE